MSPKIVLATVGTLGDLHPFIALALRLKELGCTPVIATAPDYQSRVEAAGIAFHPVRPSTATVFNDLGTNQTELTRRVSHDTRLIFQEALFPYLRVAYEDMLTALEGASLLCTSSLAFSARLAAEKLAIRWVGVVLQPLMFLSSFDPPRLAEAPGLGSLLSHLGPRASRVVFGLMKRFIDKQCAPVHELRREIGLPPSTVDPLIDGQFSHHGTIALYSKVLGDVRPDYPPRTCVAGFTFYDGAESSTSALAPALQRFLDSGSAPLVFTLGSFAVANAEDFYAVGLAAARAVKRRVVLLVGDHHPPSLPADPGSDAIVCGYAPYSAIFPRAAVIIHQGGIGTTAQALRAGRPQLVMPVFADQPDNAARVVRLGVGRTIKRKQFRERRVTTELRELLDNSAYRQRATAVSAQLAHEDGAVRAAKFLLSESG